MSREDDLKKEIKSIVDKNPKENSLSFNCMCELVAELKGIKEERQRIRNAILDLRSYRTSGYNDLKEEIDKIFK